MSEQTKVANTTTETVEQSEVLAKLLVLTFALACAPISFFYLSRDYIWNGNTTWAAITAVVAANIVLVAYIIISMREEKQVASAAKAKAGGKPGPENKKTQ